MDRDSCLIIGTGALATLFAARLSAAKTNVTILGSWKAALEVFQHNGAQIECEQPFPVNAISSPVGISSVHKSIVLVKSTNTYKAAQQLNTCLEENGCVLTLQNGLGNPEVLASYLGGKRFFSGVTTIGARLISPGLVKISGKSTIWIENHPKAESFARMLRNGGFKVTIVKDIQPYRWKKLIVNCAINPLTAILRVKNGELLDDPLALIMMERLVEESVKVSEAANIHLGLKDPCNLVKKVARETSENSSSMLQDIQRGVSTEIDALNGEIVRLGEIYGVDVSHNKLVYKLVKKRNKISSAELSD